MTRNEMIKELIQDGRSWSEKDRVHLDAMPINALEKIHDICLHGGPGSGNFGHEGRPGERGGSGGGGGESASKKAERQITAGKADRASEKRAYDRLKAEGGIAGAGSSQKAYDSAMASFRAASESHAKVTAGYRSGKVGDKEFLDSRKKQAEAGKAVDAAEAKLKAEGSRAEAKKMNKEYKPRGERDEDNPQMMAQTLPSKLVNYYSANGTKATGDGMMAARAELASRHVGRDGKDTTFQDAQMRWGVDAMEPLPKDESKAKPREALRYHMQTYPTEMLMDYATGKLDFHDVVSKEKASRL